MAIYNENNDIVSKDFYTISTASTVSEWVDAFNNNAIAGEYINDYLGDMLFNGMLYDPNNIPTIGGVPIASLTNIDLTTTGASPDNIELDNFFLYFRDINKIKALDHVTFDITDYADNSLYLFYINSDLGFRISQSYDQHDDELCLFRFIVKDDLTFLQCYVTSQRFGTSVYDAAGEYFAVQGCKPVPLADMHLKLDNGLIKRSGIKFDYHLSPDLYKVEDRTIPYNIRYITETNEVDFSILPGNTVITDKILDYTTDTLTTIDSGFTAQRILYDVYSDCLVIQYGNSIYNTMDEALTSINNVSYPFPYDVTYKPMFIPLGVMFIKYDCDDLTDAEQCVIVQQTNITISPEQSVFFAEDAYARGKLEVIDNSIDLILQSLTNLTNIVNAHTTNTSNPHQVTKLQVGLGNVDNYSYDTIKSKIQNDLANNWIRKNVNDSTTGNLYIGGGVTIPSSAFLDNQASYIKVGGHRLYVGVNPSGISGASAGDYAIWPE